jgi:parvulin-like peptidyl-prolyl isomerase
VKPQEVRVSQIFTVDRAKADKAMAEARRADSDKAFRELVDRYSEDEDSRSRGGDLTFFDRKNATLPRSLVEAAFALETVGALAGPVASDKGFHVIKLTQKRPGFTRPAAQVAPEIRRLIARDRRAKKMEEMVAEMRQRLKVEVYEDKLAKVVVPGGPK